jgi:phosphatidylinositol alpha 1,6-mannosyltransferase
MGSRSPEVQRRITGRSGLAATLVDVDGVRGPRVALVTESFDPRLSGTAGTVRQVANRLAETGYDVRVLTSGAGPAAYHAAEVLRFGPPRRSHQIHRALEAYAPDLVHVFTPGPVGAKALRQAARLGIPTLVTETSARAEFAPPQWQHKVADATDRLTVTAAWLRDRLADAGLDSGIWSPGVDTDVFHPDRRNPALRAIWTDGDLTQVAVGYVGSLRKRHGVRRLAEVASVPGTRLVVVGDGPQQAWLRERLPASVRFTGALKPRQAAAAIASLDVLVQPGTRTTCAHALREAAACAVPVVAPRAGGALDVVEHLGTGVLYDPEKPLALADAVAAVVADPHRHLLGQHARARISRRTWAVAVDELVSEHYSVLPGSSASQVA